MSAQVIEAMVLRWSESSTGGRTVTFLLPGDGDAHPFRGVKTGPAHGQRVALSVALIADDETQNIVPAREVRAQEAKRGLDKKRWEDLAYSVQAGIRCNEPGFQQCLRAADADGAARIVRAICGVESRKDIVKDTPAGKAWVGIEWEYQNWLRGAA